MGQKLYQETEAGGIKFTSQRKIGDVRIPNYVYDLWLPLIGSDGIAAYGLYCRLEMGGAVKKIGLRDLAKALRMGGDKLEKVNTMLQECGFVQVNKPTGHKRLLHWTTEIIVLDPPQEVSNNLIEKYQPPAGYEIIANWLVDSQVPTPETLDGVSGKPSQGFQENLDGVSNIESLDIESLDIMVASDKNGSELDKFLDPKPITYIAPVNSNPLHQRVLDKDPALMMAALGVTAKDRTTPGLQAIHDAGWKIGDDRIKLTTGVFLDTTPLPVPAKPERGKWLAGIKAHLEEFTLDELPRLYRLAWEEYCPQVMAGEIDITHPAALTTKMRAIKQRGAASQPVQTKFTIIDKRKVTQ